MSRLKRKTEKSMTIDPIFLKMYEDDVKNSPNQRRIFLSMDERDSYYAKNHEKVVVVNKPKRKKGVK